MRSVTTPRGRRGGTHVARGRTEPIRVAVRLRPLRDDDRDGDGRLSDARRSAWRTERVGDQQWVHFSSPAAPVVPGSALPFSGSGAGAAGGSNPLARYERASFCFDLCFDGAASNGEVFRTAARNAVWAPVSDGVNSTILAYGQTSSGKTHAILGTPQDPGILPLAARDLWADGGSRMIGWTARVSYYEIFNERVRDLICAGGHGDAAPLPVKECVDRGFYVQGLTETPVGCVEDVMRLIRRGEERRRYAQTRWNEYSSRSHVLFTMTFERVPPQAVLGGDSSDCEASQPYGVLVPSRSAKLAIVDLAGCENHKFESSEDGRYINRSLFFLGEVISRLCAGAVRGNSRAASGRRTREGAPPRTSATSADGGSPLGSIDRDSSHSSLRRGREATPGRRAGRDASPGFGFGRSSSASSRCGGGGSGGADARGDFIPYRDSKLTRLLRSSLGGNAVTCLLVTVHPAWQFVEQSMTSLRFAAKARCVENVVWLGHEPVPGRTVERTTIDAQQKIIQGLQHKLMLLESELKPVGGGRPQRQSGAPWPPPPIAVRDGLQGALGSGNLDDLYGQFQSLQQELEQKEQQLVLKTRQLSEREEQLGHLRKRLGEHSALLPSSRGANTDAGDGDISGGSLPTSQSREQPQASGARYGPPDEGGGLPVVDCGQKPTLVDAAAKPASGAFGGNYGGDGDVGGGGGRHRPHGGNHVGARGCGAGVDEGELMAASGRGRDQNSWSREKGEEPTAFQQSLLRAEDISCLRSMRYVARQQTPVGSRTASSAPSARPSAPPPPPLLAPLPRTPPSHTHQHALSTVSAAVAAATVAAAAEVTPVVPPAVLPQTQPSAPPPSDSKLATSQSQKELVDQLLHLAKMQINSLNTSSKVAAPMSEEEERPVPPLNNGLVNAGSHDEQRRPERPWQRGGPAGRSRPPRDDWAQSLAWSASGDGSGFSTLGGTADATVPFGDGLPSWADLEDLRPPSRELNLPPPSNTDVEDTPRKDAAGVFLEENADYDDNNAPPERNFPRRLDFQAMWESLQKR